MVLGWASITPIIMLKKNKIKFYITQTTNKIYRKINLVFMFCYIVVVVV